jgi:hypothetical protein
VHRLFGAANVLQNKGSHVVERHPVQQRAAAAGDLAAEQRGEVHVEQLACNDSWRHHQNKRLL